MLSHTDSRGFNTPQGSPEHSLIYIRCELMRDSDIICQIWTFCFPQSFNLHKVPVLDPLVPYWFAPLHRAVTPPVCPENVSHLGENYCSTECSHFLFLGGIWESNADQMPWSSTALFFHRAEKHYYKCSMWTILVIPLIYWEKRKIRKWNMADLILKKSRKHKSLQFPWNFKKTLIDVMVQRWSLDCSYF